MTIPNLKFRVIKLYVRLALLSACGTVLTSCAGNSGNLFLNPDFNFKTIETVGVIPFENLSDDQGAAMRVTRIFVGELLSRKAFDVIEPGEVSKALVKYSLIRAADLQKDQIHEIGKALGVQALFLGTVSESTSGRGGNSGSSEVTLVARLVETDKGATIWSATHTEGGRGFFQVLLGLEPATKSRVTMDCVKNLIKTLIN